MTDAFRQDIRSMYALAARCDTLPALIPSLFATLRRNEDSLTTLTYSYRLSASDTGYECAFRLDRGRFSELAPDAAVDVTVIGREAKLLAIFQRRLSPAKALMLRQIQVKGSREALLKLAEFL